MASHLHFKPHCAFCIAVVFMFLNLIASGQGANGDLEDCLFREAPDVFEGEVQVELGGGLGCGRVLVGAGFAEATEVHGYVGEMDFRGMAGSLDRIFACKEMVVMIYEDEIIGSMSDIVVFADVS